MPVMIYDPVYEAEVRHIRSTQGPNARDEVWNGVPVTPPLPNIEHQILATDLALAFQGAIDRATGDVALVGANISDRVAGWTENYREPDVLVVLHTNPARHCGTHWAGGPDVAVEIVSPGEDPRRKLDFYVKVNTRELLIVERDPWAVEQYQLQGVKLVLVGTATAANGAVLTSAGLPLTLQLRAGAARPTLVLTHTGTGQVWTA